MIWNVGVGGELRRALSEGDKVNFSIETDQRAPRATDLVVTESAPRTITPFDASRVPRNDSV